MTRTADDIVAQIKITTGMPSNQQLLTDDRILSFANEEIEGKILPLIDAINQEYFIVGESFPLVSGQDTYSIPTRALGRSLRDLKLVDSAGYKRQMAQVKLEDAHLLSYGVAATPTSFYFMGDKVVIAPVPSGGVTASLMMYYFSRPGRLTATTNCAQITGISTNGTASTTFTVSQLPSSFTVGSVSDFIAGQSGNSLIDKDRTVSNVSGSQITYGFVNSAISVGDWIAPQYQSPVLMVPEEALSYLVALTSERCLMAIGDVEGAQVVAKGIPERRSFLQSIIAPRISGECIKIINRNGLLKGNRFRFGRSVLYP